MGCCLSTTDAGKSSAFGPQKHRRSLAGTEESRSDAARESRAPPPIDEETVKEVLSETPKPKHPPQSSPPPLFKHEPVLDRHQGKIAASEEEELPVFVSLKTKIDLEKIEQKVPSCNNNDGGGEVSELSEICSLSESVSGTTVTRDDDEEVHQRFVNRSPMKFRQNRDSSMGQRRDRVVGKSPSRITESSPGRRYGPNGAGSVRLVQSREQSPSQPMSRRWSRVSRPESNRRDPGESSGRRSRSPATRVTDGGGVDRANVGRSPSARKYGKYPGRTTIGPIESSSSGPIRRVAEEPHNEGNWPANESLDNPHVSLECFIFL